MKLKIGTPEDHRRVRVYRKRPVKIAAMQLMPETFNKVLDWVGMNNIERNDRHTCTMRIKTLEKEVVAMHGDYIIRGVAGEFYPCKPDIFAKTYEIISPKDGAKPRKML